MQNDILRKLTTELINGINTEAQTVYFLVQIRKLIEHNNSTTTHDTLNMFCDWALHIGLSKNRQITELLKEFDESMIRNDNGYGPIKYDYLSMKKFKETMEGFLTEFNLPKNILKREEWPTFVRLYTGVVSDCPITKKDYPFKFIKEVSISMSDQLPNNTPPEYFEQRKGLYLQWRVTKKDGTQTIWEFMG